MGKRRILSIVVAVFFTSAVLFAYFVQPDTYIVYQNRSWKNANVSRIKISHESVEVSKGEIVPKEPGDYAASLSIFGIPYKSVTLKVIEDEKVILGGQAVGIRLYSDDLVVVAVGRVNEGNISPGETAGIKEGDVIKKVEGKKVSTPDEFSELICNARGEITILTERDGAEREVKITPEVSLADGVKRVGLWVRDSTAGVGTLTYTDPESLMYGALGHAVSDSDTGVRFSVKRGSIEECGIEEIKKGEKGVPGELKGEFFANGQTIGNITKNEQEGIFGNAAKIPEGELIGLGHKSEIKKGKAYIHAALDDEIVKKYEIEIVRVSKNMKNPGKGFVIKVVDKELIEKTGGIVQGMSGSPITQNGKLVGAVTHVLVNDPTMGYGIFIENMIEASKN